MASTGRKKQPKIEEPDITGLKFFDKLAPLLKRLHQDSCERDKANNAAPAAVMRIKL